MSALIYRINNVKKIDFSTSSFAMEYFWNSLLLATLVLATLVVLAEVL